MLEGVRDEIAYIRARLDRHIDDQRKDFERVHEEIGKVREETRAHKTKFSIIASGVALVMAAIVTWITDHFRHT